MAVVLIQLRIHTRASRLIGLLTPRITRQEGQALLHVNFGNQFSRLPFLVAVHAHR
jgi:hypothetical protein